MHYNKYLTDLFDKFNTLTDIRHQSYITYNMKVICVTRLFGLICGLTSLSNISSDEFNTEVCINSISTICNTKLSELPYLETIQDVFINIKLSELKDIQKYIVKTLIHSKMFDKYVEAYKNKSTTFKYISNIDINDSKIKEVVSLGRRRRKIENESFYTQKHRPFDITHLNSRNDNSMKCHYYFIQFVHTIRQLLEQGNILTKSLKLKIKEVSVTYLMLLLQPSQILTI